eukprot:jgi/Mesvir1/17955/Mv13001-RA.1
MSKRLSTQRSLAAALSNENTSAAPAAASPTGPEGSGATTSQALVVAQPPLAASPAASPEPKRSRPAEPTWEEFDFDASQPGFFDKLNPAGHDPGLRVLGILRDIDQRPSLRDNAIAIEVLQNTAGITAQAVKDIAAKPASAGLAGDAPPITTWADMLKQHTTSTTSAVAAQLQRQTLDLREEAELAKRSLNVIVKNFKMEEGENSEKLARAFEREILDRMGLTGEIELAAHRLPRARGKAGPPPLLLTFKTPADKISFLRRRNRLEKTLFTLDDDLTLAQQQRRRELWPTYLQLRQTKAGQPVYWKGAAIYVGHKPWQATPPPPRPQRLQTPQLRGIQQ